MNVTIGGIARTVEITSFDKLGDVKVCMLTTTADGSVGFQQLNQEVIDAIDSKAIPNGQYEDMTVGSAEQLLSTQYDTDSVPYAFRKSPYGDREFDEIHGGTIAWNQRVQNGNFANTGAWSAESGVTLTVSNNVGTITSTIEANGIRQSFYPISNHKYLATFEAYASSDIRLKLVIGTSSLYAVDVYATSNKQTFSKIGIFNGTLSSTYLYLFTATVGTVNVSNVMVIDLTAMFGSAIADYIYSLEQSNTGSGVAWFKSLFPKPYYAYNAGALISVSGLSAHKMTGFNQFDAENATVYYAYLRAEGGGYSPKWIQVSDSRSFAIKCFPNTTYCAYLKDISVPTIFRIGAIATDLPTTPTSGGWQISLEKNLTSVSSIPTTYTTGADAKYLIIQATASTIESVRDALCINISGERNGEYEPYESHSYALDSSLTLRGVPKLVDNKVQFDGDIYASDGSVQRRYGIVTLNGSETWGMNATSHNGYLSMDSVKRVSDYRLSMISSYLPVINQAGDTSTSAMASWVSAYYNNSTNVGKNWIYVHIDGITTAADLKAYLANKPLTLVYELATPTTESASPYVSPQICNEYGTEEYISAEQSGVTMIVGHNTKYPQNLRKKIEGLPWNFSNLIAPTEVTNKASRNYTVGSFLIMNNTLYKVTSAIANGGTITVGSNVSATTIMQEILAL